jgi:transcriptional regulator with XRE-family HTH domain
VIDVAFGEKLKKRREEKGMSQDDVAGFFGENFSRQAVSKWERGDGYPEVNILLILVAKLDISLDILFEEELNYLKKKTPNDMMEKYPGVEAGLKVIVEYLSKL